MPPPFMPPVADAELVIRLPQHSETTLQAVQRAHYSFRLAYARASETRAASDVGQDFLTLRDNAERHSFALCDGVGQSFMGDLAAKLLGSFLRDWMWELDSSATAPAIGERLDEALATLAARAERQVRVYPLPGDLSPLVKDALERKRRAGTESTFVCGIIDPAANLVGFAWMGDSRLRLWGSDGQERSGELGDEFRTAERWSSRRGPIGSVHCFVGAFDQYTRVAVYSDGLASLDTDLDPSPDAATLMEVLGAADAALSDDASLIELVFVGAAQPVLPASWAPLADLPALLAATADTINNADDQPADAEIPAELSAFDSQPHSPQRIVQTVPLPSTPPATVMGRPVVMPAVQALAASLFERLRADQALLLTLLAGLVVLLLALGSASYLLTARRANLVPTLGPALSATPAFSSPSPLPLTTPILAPTLPAQQKS